MRSWHFCAAPVLAIALAAISFSSPALAACTYGSCAPSNATINNQITQSASTQTAGIIADRINNAVSDIGGLTSSASAVGTASTGTQVLAYGGGDGKAAGSGPRSMGAWADVANLQLKNTAAGSDYSGSIFTGIGGLDYNFNDRFLLGTALGYEKIDIDTRFNSGTLKSSGFASAIYGAYIFSPAYSLDFQFGRAWISYKETHGATGSFNADRWSGSTNFNAKQLTGNWRFTESFGYFYVNEKQDGYIESNGNAVAASTVYLGQIRVKGSVGYNFLTDWGSVMPFASARLEFDVRKSAAPVINSQGQTADNGSFGTTFGLGYTAKVGQSVTTTLEGTTTQFRKNFESYGLKGTVRVNF